MGVTTHRLAVAAALAMVAAALAMVAAALAMVAAALAMVAAAWSLWTPAIWAEGSGAGPGAVGICSGRNYVN